MANRTFLAFLDRTGPYTPVDLDADLAASYSIPVFWLTLFAPDDMTPRVVVSEDFQTAHTGLESRTAPTINRSLERLQRMGPYFDPAFREAIDQWSAFLASSVASNEFVVCDTEELSAMYEDDDAFATDLRRWLTGIDRPIRSVEADAALAQSYLVYDPIRGRIEPTLEEDLTIITCGYAWSDQSRWSVRTT